MWLAGAAAAVLVAVALAGPAQQPAGPAPESEARSAYGKLPLAFVENRGQTDTRVRYHAQAPGLSVFLTPDKAVISLTKGDRGTALELRFVGANSDVRIEPRHRMQGKVSYLNGTAHETGLSTYREITYRGLWPGIDMVLRGAGGKLKYEFHAAAGADPSRIRLAYGGAEGLSLGATGDLVVATPLGTMRDARPVTYQRMRGERVPVASRYVLHGKRSYGFALGRSDAALPLVIDPGLEFSTGLGPSSGVNEIAVDASGNAYVVTETNSSTYPTTPGAFDTTHNSLSDVVVTKFSSTGSPLVYSTYLGGTRSDLGTAIALDANGRAHVTGYTNSTDFPLTTGVADAEYEGTVEAFVVRLNPGGTALDYSTYLGGNFEDYSNAIAVDGGGSAYVSGRTTSSDFPTTEGAFDRTDHDFEDAFVTKLNPTGSALTYSTYLGGNRLDRGTGVAVVGGALYVTGITLSSDFPTTPGAFDGTYNGTGESFVGLDIFVTKLNATGTGLVGSTYLGGARADTVSDIAVDQAGNPYVTGETGSADFPVTPGAFDTTIFHRPNTFEDTNAVVTKLTGALTALAYSTFLGNVSSGNGIVVDATDSAHVTGYASEGFPTTPDAFDPSHNEIADVFLSRLAPDGSSVTYSTYLGGNSSDIGMDIALGPTGAIWVGGRSHSSDFPTTPGALQPNSGFVAKLTAPRGFSRPKTARSVEVSLVTAFVRCDKPNSNHGPPLAYPSCNPPLHGSGELTSGTPDANGLPAGGSGLAKYLALPGSPATPADEADVQISFSLHDVYNRFGLTEYTGGVRLVTSLRITDKSEIPGTTVTDTPLSANVGCATTADPQTGSSCTLVTSVEALLPGAVPEGKRSVWELGQVQVQDAGPDDDVDTSADNTLFMVQGVFAP